MKSKQKKTAVKPKQKKTAVDNLVLEIPLMHNISETTGMEVSETTGMEVSETTGMEVSETTGMVHQPPLVIPDNVYEDIINELRNDPNLYSILNDMDLSCGHQDDGHQLTNTQDIPDSEIDELIQELAKEPQWESIVNDVETFQINEQTPLEKELIDIGYSIFYI